MTILGRGTTALARSGRQLRIREEGGDDADHGRDKASETEAAWMKETPEESRAVNGQPDEPARLPRWYPALRWISDREFGREREGRGSGRRPPAGPSRWRGLRGGVRRPGLAAGDGPPCRIRP